MIEILIENDIDPIGVMLFGILAICLAWVWISDRTGRGESRYDRDEAKARNLLDWIEEHPGRRIKLPGGHETDRVRRYLPKVNRIINRWGGAPEDIIERVDKLEQGRWGK